jgi:ribonuclease E
MSEPTIDRDAYGAPVENGPPPSEPRDHPESRPAVGVPGAAEGPRQSSSPRRPQIGDTRPAPPSGDTPTQADSSAQRNADGPAGASGNATGTGGNGGNAASGGNAGSGGANGGSGGVRRRRGGRGRRRGSSGGGGGGTGAGAEASGKGAAPGGGGSTGSPEGPRADARPATAVKQAMTSASAQTADRPARPNTPRARRKERGGKAVGRYLMCVHVEPEATQIAVLEGRALVEHFVARPQDDAQQIIGNIYRGRVKNVLPGMEAAFVDIGTPKNAVLYWGDVSYDRDEIDRQSGADRIEHLLRPGQTIVSQVTKNPIGLKGARLTQEVSLPGRFVVLVPNSSTYGISRRLDDNERKRLRRVLDEVRPEGHGLIVRTAAQGASAEELRHDVQQLVAKWDEIDERSKRLPAPALLYSEPHMAVRIIREELTEEHRSVLIDDRELYEVVKAYVAEFDPELAERVELYDNSVETLPLFERQHVHEQLHKALDRKVWLPSGGSLIIERTEALAVIDVNTGKNVGSSSLEETVFENNLEAADEIARQLRLRDIGGIIVIDFIDMEIKTNRQAVLAAFKAALARDKTPTQVFEISELGLVEMTRKRVGEGLVETLSETCPMCNGRGIVFREGPTA